MQRSLGWLNRLFPELNFFEDPPACRLAWRRATRVAIYGNPWFWLSLVILPIVLVLTIKLLPPPNWLPRYMEVGFRDVVGGLYVSVGAIYVFKRPLERSLRRQLLEAGVPGCMACGYCLRGIVEPRCPECGRVVPRGDESQQR